MRILILNWRDIKNPSAGGAEILTWEIAKRWIKKGHRVTQFSSEFPSCSHEESIDGIRIIRRGHPDARYIFSSVHFQAFFHYFKDFKGEFDIVIDEIHGLPFFTPLFIKEKKVALICEVADNLWQKLYGPFFGTIGRIVETMYLRLTYKSVPFLTISKSSKDDLVRHGVLEKNITVLPMGITIPKSLKPVKKNKNQILYVGRLSKSKGIEDAIIAVSLLTKSIRNIRLLIVGRGEQNYTKYLKQLVERLAVSKNVSLLGFVSQNEKFELMAGSLALLAPSVKEGFGLTVPEAGHVLTPSIVYNSQGLIEIVKNGISGIVCKKNTPLELSRNIQELYVNKPLYAKLSKGAFVESKKYNWDITAETALTILKREIYGL